MCLGDIAQVTAVAPGGRVEVRVGDRVTTSTLLAVTDAIGPGDWVLVHSGLVLALLTEQEAKDALELRDTTRHERKPDEHDTTHRPNVGARNSRDQRRGCLPQLLRGEGVR